MASDRQQFARAEAHWEALWQDRAFSRPESIGTLAIVCSGYQLGMSDDPAKQASSFSREAREIAKTHRQYGRPTEVVDNATADDLRALLKDPTVSSIVTIGHGALSYLYIDNGSRLQQNFRHAPDAVVDNRFDWRDVAEAADHLKTGSFVQRHCGSYARRLSVPLGTFAMIYHNKVQAAVGAYFLPKDLKDRHNELVRPVCTQKRLSYGYIKEHFDYEEFLKGSRTAD